MQQVSTSLKMIIAIKQYITRIFRLSDATFVELNSFPDNEY